MFSLTDILTNMENRQALLAGKPILFIRGREPMKNPYLYDSELFFERKKRKKRTSRRKSSRLWKNPIVVDRRPRYSFYKTGELDGMLDKAMTALRADLGVRSEMIPIDSWAHRLPDLRGAPLGVDPAFPLMLHTPDALYRRVTESARRKVRLATRITEQDMRKQAAFAKKLSAAAEVTMALSEDAAKGYLDYNKNAVEAERHLREIRDA